MTKQEKRKRKREQRSRAERKRKRKRLRALGIFKPGERERIERRHQEMLLEIAETGRRKLVLAARLELERCYHLSQLSRV